MRFFQYVNSTNKISVRHWLEVQKRKNYHDKVLDHYSNPRNSGSLDRNKKNVGTGLAGAPSCGDVMKLQIEVDEKSKVITNVKFKTYGCGSAIASSSYLTELVKGKTIDEALAIKNKAISSNLLLPPIKMHCSVLAEDAIKLAIKDYISKKNSELSNKVAHK